MSKQEQRAEETKKSILLAAGKLFAKRGYDHVTMREIAKEAGCSHTTIYIYFKDKEALLHRLSMPVLEDLRNKMEYISADSSISFEQQLKEISREFIYFCLLNRSMYTIFITAQSSRVDVEEPNSEINKLRLELFNIIKQVIRKCLSIDEGEQLLAFARIFFFNIQGIVATYSYPHETLDTLMERLIPTFDEAVAILLLGFKEKLKQKGL
ncbi:TetR/AcrR family transcriptional regulator [Bacillus sp. FJAT-49736]|uniref:TetR/AcrR family transcriptional regulator n=1 Tax=Bacillus sp. FJAT-49736 TaxID=2833582 RepID=UPI001BCA66E6|nr:TetR/AcrR family transcriptional regulator [Bacillus sp. FJAT-49736]MBS4174718.1 TetR/AcrR family transcriptional regulator [Bacillus sp. FJAT-49736]